MDMIATSGEVEAAPAANLITGGRANCTRSGGFFGNRLAEYFGMKGTKLLEVSRQGMLALVVTRLTCARSGRIGGSPIAPESAFSIFHELGDVGDDAGTPDRRRKVFGSSKGSSVHITDLDKNGECELSGPFDALQYYVPYQALADLEGKYGISSPQVLALESDRGDPFLTITSGFLLRAADELGTEGGPFAEQFALSVLAHFAIAYGLLRACKSATKGGLAPWQERRAKEMMRANLASALSIGDIATQCRLTHNHFARCFRRSTGLAPQRYLTRLRVQEAKRLMQTTKLSLTDIALACGFGEQSYFTRVFSRSVGASPGAWRRLISKG